MAGSRVDEAGTGVIRDMVAVEQRNDEFIAPAAQRMRRQQPFEIVDTGPRIGETWDCVRTVVAPLDAIFAGGFE